MKTGEGETHQMVSGGFLCIVEEKGGFYDRERIDACRVIREISEDEKRYWRQQLERRNQLLKEEID